MFEASRRQIPRQIFRDHPEHLRYRLAIANSSDDFHRVGFRRQRAPRLCATLYTSTDTLSCLATGYFSRAVASVSHADRSAWGRIGGRVDLSACVDSYVWLPLNVLSTMGCGGKKQDGVPGLLPPSGQVSWSLSACFVILIWCAVPILSLKTLLRGPFCTPPISFGASLVARAPPPTLRRKQQVSTRCHINFAAGARHCCNASRKDDTLAPLERLM